MAYRDGFSRRHVDTCPPAGKDGRRPRHNCRGPWIVSVELGWENHKRVRKFITGKTKGDVEAKKAAFLAERAQGVHSDSATVAEWLTYWLDEIAPTRTAASTLATYSGYIKNRVIPVIGRRQLRQLGASDMRQLQQSLIKAGLADPTRRQIHAIVRRALKVAVQDGKIPRNPADLVDAPPVRVRHHDAHTTQEALTLLASARTAYERARLNVALLAGLRQGEALGLDWADVNLSEGHLRVHQVAQRVKGQGMVILPRIKAGEGEERWVHLLPEVVEALRSLAEETGRDGLVFGKDGKIRRPEFDHRQWKAWCRRAGVREVPLHGARASCSTRLQELGVPPHIVAAVLGHADLAVTLARYTRSELSSQRAALAGLPAAVTA